MAGRARNNASTERSAKATVRFAVARAAAGALIGLLAAGASAQEDARRSRRWERFWQRPQTSSKYHDSVKRAFAPVVARARKGTVGVYCGGKQVALGTVVDAGLVATKASELSGPVECRPAGGKPLKAALVGTDEANDLALLKVDGGGITPVQWADSDDPPVGSWIVTPGLDDQPLSLGVVSVRQRSLPSPRRALPRYGFLGISFDTESDEPRIEQVYPNTAAAHAKLRPSDLIVALGEEEVRDRAELQSRLRRSKPGDEIKLRVRRGEKDIDIAATLGEWLDGRQLNPQEHMGGELSLRSSGFSRVIQHDSALRPDQCGGPAVDSDGKAVGVNIARAGRVESYVLPASTVRAIVAKLKSKPAAKSKVAPTSAPTQPARALPRDRRGRR
ncbi:MAG TPA: PDZ domain-containing protein [Phycisphaerae bacterium]|nr:PDZ domain-containing protein [Phycisphaerae bacterium]